jgi:hypothetical protein
MVTEIRERGAGLWRRGRRRKRRGGWFPWDIVEAAVDGVRRGRGREQERFLSFLAR